VKNPYLSHLEELAASSQTKSDAERQQADPEEADSDETAVQGGPRPADGSDEAKARSSQLSFKASRGAASAPKPDRQAPAPGLSDPTRPGLVESGTRPAESYGAGIPAPPVESILAKLDGLTSETVVDSEKKHTRNILILASGVLLVIVVTFATAPLNIPDLTKWLSRLCYACTFLGTVFGAQEAFKILIRKDPLKAQKIYARIAIGSSLEIANSYMDAGDFLTAERILEQAAKKMTAKHAKKYISAYGLLAVIHAHTGRTDAADAMIKQVLAAAAANHGAGPTDSNAALLAMTLNYAGEILELKGEFDQALKTYTRALQVLISQRQPQTKSLVIILANVGHANNLLAHYEDAVNCLAKADQLSERISDLLPAQLAFILSARGTALRGVNQLEKSAECLNQSLEYARKPFGQRQLGNVYYDLAKLYVTAERLQEGEESYSQAVAAYESRQPKATPELVRVLQDYAYFLRSVSQDEQADATKKKAAQMQTTLHDINLFHQTKNVKKINAAVVKTATKRPRFPFFWMVLVGFWGYSVWNGGLRAASPYDWYWLLGALTIFGVKVKHSMSPPSREELSEGITSFMAYIPFVRSILPELSAMSKRSIAVVVAWLILVAVGSKYLLPAPNTVPDGLFAFEYLVWGRNLAAKESFSKARDALSRAVKMDPNGHDGQCAQHTIDCRLPKSPQPEAAVQANMDALALLKNKDTNGAIKAWQDCIQQYPKFEWPYIHLSKLYARQHKLDDADGLLKKVLAENPNCADALFAMGEIQGLRKDHVAAMDYFKKAATLKASTGDPLEELNASVLAKVDSSKLKNSKSVEPSVMSDLSSEEQRGDETKDGH